MSVDSPWLGSGGPVDVSTGVVGTSHDLLDGSWDVTLALVPRGKGVSTYPAA